MTIDTTTQIAEYSVTTAELAKLKARFQGIEYDVTTTAGLDTAKKDRRELVALRTTLEAKRSEIKAPALAQCNLIDSEAKRIKAEILALETPIDTVIKQEEARKEAEKAEKARLAAEAQKVLDDKIVEIARLPQKCFGNSANQITLFLAALEARPFGGEFTGDTLTRAEAAKTEAVAEIRAILAKAVETEAEAARIEAERVENDRLAAIQREQMAAQQAELDEQKRLNDIESARLAELSKAEEERTAVAKKKEDEAAAELKRQQDVLDSEKREKEKQEAIEAEQKRVVAEKEKKAAEKKARLLAARCKDAETALIKILEICRNEDLDGTDALAQIELIAEASI
jgi:hypothetical protein